MCDCVFVGRWRLRYGMWRRQVPEANKLWSGMLEWMASANADHCPLCAQEDGLALGRRVSKGSSRGMRQR